MVQLKNELRCLKSLSTIILQPSSAQITANKSIIDEISLALHSCSNFDLETSTVIAQAIGTLFKYPDVATKGLNDYLIESSMGLRINCLTAHWF